MIRLPALALAMVLPDRLPSLIVLAGFWIPPAVAGWVRRGRCCEAPSAAAP